MWWWQSVALAGTLVLGRSVPSDHFTGASGSGAAQPATPPPAAASAPIAFIASRRLVWIASIASSPLALSCSSSRALVSVLRVGGPLHLRTRRRPGDVVAPAARSPPAAPMALVELVGLAAGQAPAAHLVDARRAHAAAQLARDRDVPLALRAQLLGELQCLRELGVAELAMRGCAGGFDPEHDDGHRCIVRRAA